MMDLACYSLGGAMITESHLAYRESQNRGTPPASEAGFQLETTIRTEY